MHRSGGKESGMRVITQQAQGELVEKKSRFIATIRPVETREEAEQFIAEMKKKYWDARHNCSAYVLGAGNETMHSSDDGEPGGTAGRPMLAVLTGQDVHNVAVVVTRYFGGVLLGTGGLVRAYQGAVLSALENARIAEQVTLLELDATVDYSDVGRVEYFVSQHDEIRLEGREYTDKVKMMMLVQPEKADQMIEGLTQATNARASLKKGREREEVM